MYLQLFYILALVSLSLSHIFPKFSTTLFIDSSKREKKKKKFITVISWNTNGVIQNSLDFPKRFSQGLNDPFFLETKMDTNSTNNTSTILCLQEIFSNALVQDFAIKELKKKGYDNFFYDEILTQENKKQQQKKSKNKSKTIYETSGLLTCSNSSSSLSLVSFNAFQYSTSFDIFAQKGFLHTKTRDGVHIINLHLQSILREYHIYDTFFFSRISIYQRKQLKQLFHYLKTRFNQTDKIVIVGDFNINPYFDFFNGIYLSLNMHVLGFTLRPFDSCNFQSKKYYDCQCLDHVWFKNLSISSTVHANESLLLFSDHLPVKTTFSYYSS